MPIYEYRCSTCGKTIEKLQKFSDAPLEVHDDCGGKLEKLISTSALQFKGTGFYITDYAKGSGSKSESHSKSDSPASKSESKTESKSEGKSESKSDSGGSSESKSESKTESKPAAPAAKSD